MQRPEWGKLAVAELEERLRRRQVLESVSAERAQHGGVEQGGGPVRHDHLPAVRGGADARRAMHVHASVALGPHDRLTRVQAHAHAQQAGRELGLRVGRGSCRGARVGKGDEERVALRVDFDSPLAGARGPQDPPVLGERLHVARAQVLEKPRRAFDVREEERDGAGGKLTHPAIMRQRVGRGI